MTDAILVTGAGGMIGRRLVTTLANHGHKVIAASRRRLRRPHGILNPVGDLADASYRRKLFQHLSQSEGQSRVVVHLAAQNLIGQTPQQFKSAYQANVALTEALLEGSARTACDRFVFSSSGLVYGTRSRLPRTELASTMWAPTFYAATKLAAEKLVQAWAGVTGMHCEILRLSNVFGPESSEATVVGRILAQARKRLPIEVATLVPVRDFVFVDEVTDGIARLIATPSDNPVVISNLGTGVGTSIAQLARTVARLAGVPVTSVDDSFTTRSTDCLILNAGGIRKRLGWAPRSDLDAQLRACIESSTKPIAG